MKMLSALLLASSLALASCTTSLEQLAESQHQADLHRANANLPLTQGAHDGLGSSIVDTSLTLDSTSTDQHKSQ